MTEAEFKAWMGSDCFTALETAALVMGYPPSSTSQKQVEPILRRMRISYALAVDALKVGFSPDKELAADQVFPMAPTALKSCAMAALTDTNNPEFKRQKTWKWLNDNSEADDQWSISRFDTQYFERVEIARWLLAVGIHSEFPFDPVDQSNYKTMKSGGADVTKTPNRTTLMDAVEDASAKFWGVNVRPEQPDTHPSNGSVSDWLVINRSVNPSMADKIASIVRPSWAHKGATLK